MKLNVGMCGRLSGWQGRGNPERILSGLERFGTRPVSAQNPPPFLYGG